MNNRTEYICFPAWERKPSNGVRTCRDVMTHGVPFADVNRPGFTCRENCATMALKMERFTSPGKGNGLRATASIRRGELLLSTEPLASCVSARRAREVCHHCFTRSASSTALPLLRIVHWHSISIQWFAPDGAAGSILFFRSGFSDAL